MKEPDYTKKLYRLVLWVILIVVAWQCLMLFIGTQALKGL